MKKILLVMAGLLCLGLSSRAQSEDIVKTGYNFGPVPAVAFDADKGFQMGALVNIYNYGDGSGYPNYNSLTYLEASYFTKGSLLLTARYDNRVLIPGVRIFGGVTANIDKVMDFYGFGGYRSSFDSSAANAYYRMNRVQILGCMDFIGDITDNLQWLAGYHPTYFKTGAVDKEDLGFGGRTLYEQYADWGLLSEAEAAGGFSSAVRLGLQYDSRDKEGAPTRGIWAAGFIAAAPKWLGTKNPFYRYSLTMRQYFPLIDNDILTAAYRLNYEGTLGSSAPFYILPYMSNMVRDFDKDGMGGYDTVRGLLRDRVVGLDMATWTAEMRWRFVKFQLWKQNISFALIGFTDGTVVTRDRDMSLKNPAFQAEYDAYMSGGSSTDTPHLTAGGGLRFIMNENFIIAFDYGMPLSPQDGSGAFYINTGYLF